jgi:hypothetical protein
MALADGRTLLFVDASGFCLLPAVARTNAPVGETPILRHRLTHDHLSVIGAVGLDAALYFRVHEHAITGVEVVGFCGICCGTSPASCSSSGTARRSTAVRSSSNSCAPARPPASTWNGDQ